MKQRRKEWMLCVIYKYTGDLSLDKELFRVVGRHSDGSGCGFGERDHVWYFKSKSNCNITEAKIKRELGKKIRVWVDPVGESEE